MLAILLIASAAAGDYLDLVEGIEARRAALSHRWSTADPTDRPGLLAEARETVEHAIVEELLPAWRGTPWSFHGDAEAPGVEPVACGYYVTAILRDAGFRVERGRLARQASENIIRTLSPRPTIVHRIGRTAAASVDELSDGVYIAGLDYHTGFVVIEEGAARFCDSSYVDPVAVTCQPVAESASFSSNYRVFGPTTADETLASWLNRSPARPCLPGSWPA